MAKKPSDSRVNPPQIRETPGVAVRQIWLEMVILAVIGMAVPATVYLDMIVIFGMMSERSTTEAGQLFLLALSAMFYARGASRLASARGYLVLMATLSTIMCIRESDGLLDTVAQGFWVYPVLLTAVLGAILTWQNRTTVKSAFLHHFASRYGMLVLLGLFLLIVFSRAFGSGDLWRAIMVENYTPQIKGAIQEGLELLGYAIFAFGTVGSSKTDFR